MKEPTVPWWRRAIQFALGGIVGLFRRNGKTATATEPETSAASHVVSAPNRDETFNPETPVKETPPQPEPVAVHSVAAPEVAPSASESTGEPIVPPLDPPTEIVAPAAEILVPEPPAPEPPAPQPPADELPAPAVSEPEIPTAPAPVDQVALEETPELPAAITTQSEEAVAVEESPIATPEIPSESTEEPTAPTAIEPIETTQTAETASSEDVTQTIEIEVAAEAEPETIVPQAEFTPEAETTPLGEPESAQAAEAEAAAAEPPTTPPPPVPVPEPPPQPEPLPGSVPDPLPSPVPIDIAPTLPFAEKHERSTAEKVAALLKARGEDAEQSPFNVMVNEVYDGPLDLLLDLIRKQDIDIYDIPIAKITSQFLAYVNQLRASDMDVAGEFIYTASLLIHIKSKMLLPRSPSGPDDAEDPRRELVERLLEHERFKNAAQMLLERQMLEYATWSNPGIREFQEDSAAEPEIAADTTDLVRVFSDILERARNRPIINVEDDSVTVGQMIQFLTRRLTMEDKPVALRRMLSHTKSERALIAMFLALLELVRLQAILLRQDRQFSEIFIKKHTGFEALMNQGLADARDDWR